MQARGMGYLNADRAALQPAGGDAGGIGEVVGTDDVAVAFELVATCLSGVQPSLAFDACETGLADTAMRCSKAVRIWINAPLGDMRVLSPRRLADRADALPRHTPTDDP